MDFLKTVTGKVVSGVVVLVVAALGVTWWQMDQATKDLILSSSGKVLGWIGLVGLLPWATFFVIAWVARFESNLAAGVLVFVYTAGEAFWLYRLFTASSHSNTAWTFFALGTLLAGVYNLLICDWIAEKLEK